MTETCEQKTLPALACRDSARDIGVGKTATLVLVLPGVSVGPYFCPVIASYAEKRCWVTAQKTWERRGTIHPLCEDGGSISRCSRAHSYACPSASSLRGPILQPEATDADVRVKGTRKVGLRLHITPGEDG